MKEVKQTPDAEMVERTRIKTHPALQVRDPALLKLRERTRQEDQSEMHVHDMALLLKADPKAELVPLHLADVGGELFVVDGHHRLRSYTRAKRDQVPAQVRAMTMVQASHASKLANVAGAKLEMRPTQKRNALWHHLAVITDRGTDGLPKGVSLRTLGGRFAVSPETVRSMLKRLPEVDPTTFPPEHLDAITGWPHWPRVCATVRNGMYQEMSPDVRTRYREDKLLGKLARVMDREEPEIVRGALRRYVEEARGDEGDLETRRDLERTGWLLTDEGQESDF
ncbi:hypothetical protein [Lysobacter sp. A421]